MLLSNFNIRVLCEIETPMLQTYFHCNEICKNQGDMLKELCLIRDKWLFNDFDVREIPLLIDLISLLVKSCMSTQQTQKKVFKTFYKCLLKYKCL